jgi:hypothetical protein
VSYSEIRNICTVEKMGNLDKIKRKKERKKGWVIKTIGRTLKFKYPLKSIFHIQYTSNYFDKKPYF